MAKKGRPSTYRKEYAEMLLKHLAAGYSFEAFGGVVKVHKDTLYEWNKKHKEFADAKKLGLEQGRLYWELITKKAILGEIKNVNSTLLIFTLKNRLGWRDRPAEDFNSRPFEPIVIELPLANKKLEINNKK